MPHTRSKESWVSPVKSPLKQYQRRRYQYIPPSSSPPPLPLPATNHPLPQQLHAPLVNPMGNQPEDLTTVLARVNIKFPTFKGLSTEDADDHIRRFLSLCRGRGLNREDAYLVLFPSTLDSLADKWFSQFAPDHFLTWNRMRTSFCDTFRPSNYRERILDQLENLELQKGETFAELMTRTTALVGRLPDQPGDFMIRKWVEKALPKQTQQKLRENLRPDSALADFVATATQIEDARLLFTDTTRDIPTRSAS